MLQVIRIDDRLIHGQVIVGWRSKKIFNKIIVCDREICEEAWEQEILSSVCPEDLQVEFKTASQIVAELEDIQNEDSVCMILIGKISVMEELTTLSLPWSEINIGGIHYEPGREKIVSYLYLSETEKLAFRDMIRKGYHFIVQDLPGNPKYELEELLH